MEEAVFETDRNEHSSGNMISETVRCPKRKNFLYLSLVLLTLGPGRIGSLTIPSNLHAA